jgi:purine nucleoside permease
MTLDVNALVLPAFDDLNGLPGEAAPWRAAYDLEGTIEIAGVPTPLRYSDRGLAVVPTGIGKAAAATTTTALLSEDRLDINDALVLSVGVAGGPPTLPVGSVVVADAIVDWDDKCRVDPTDEGEADAEDGGPIALNPYTAEQGVFELDPDLVASARSLAENIGLATTAGGAESADEVDAPRVVGGTNLCGDEIWHGRALAEQAERLVETRGVGPYRATEMEDAGTAAALERFDRLDRYLSIRGISNHDRPEPGVSARESLFSPTFEDGFEVGIESAVSVARSVVDDRLE